MTADIYSLIVRVDSTQVNRAESDLQRLQRESRQTERAMNSLSSSAKALAGAFAGISIGSVFTTAIKEIATFETKMNQLKALTMANTEQMKLMENQARSLGATTAFSAQQAAEAQGVLASTGLKANQIMSATPKILALAAAGNLDLAKAAEISMASMKGLGLQIEDLGHINDVFAKVAADSAISVEQVGIAMGEAAPSMRTFGISLEQTAAAIGILKDNGIKVGSIGDGLKSMMGALANETKEHNKILEKHNLSYKDLNVEVLGLTKVLNNLKNANLSAKESIALLGLDAFNTSVILMNNTKALEGNSSALVKTSGDAQTQANILNQGLSKAWDALKGSLSEVALQMGETKAGSDSLAGGLTSLIQQATGVISIWSGLGNQFRESNKLTAEQYGHLKDIAGALSSFGSAAKGVAVLTAAIWSLRAAQLAFNIAARANPYIAGATALAAGTGYVYDKMNQFNERQKGHLKEIKTLEEANLGVQKQQQAVKNLTDVGASKKVIDEAKSRLDALKQQRDTFEKGAARPVLEIVDETEQWYSEGNTKKIKANSAAIDESGESAKKTGAAHKGLSDAQKQANQDQSLFNSLLERTPIGAYKASMDDLNYALKKGGIDQDTYNYLAKQTAETFERATVNTKQLTDAERERQQVFAQSARGQFESGYSSLQKSKEFMTAKEYELKQGQLLDSYLSATGNAPKESSKDFKSFNSEIAKATESFNQLGNSGKMAFDGILGGISAVAGAATSFSEEMTKLNDNFSNASKSYSDFMLKEGTTFEEREKATASYYKMKSTYDSASFKAEISGARQIAGATSKLFGEKSAARKAFHAVEMGLSVIEMAMAAKKMVVDVAAGAANMFAQGGFAGFAGVAAMTAVMAGLGFAVSGGSGGKAVDNTMKATSEVGTVLGNKEAQSNSISAIVKTLNEIDQRQFPQLKELNDSFKKLEFSLSSFVTTIARRTDSFTNMIGGLEMPSGGKGDLLGGAGQFLGVIGGWLFGTKTTVTKLGEGFIFEFGNLFNEGAADAIKGKTFLKYQTTKKSLFGSSSKISEIYGAIDDEIMSDMQKLFGYVGESLLTAFDTMNVTGILKDRIALFTLGSQKWDFSKADDKEKYFNAMINATADRMANVAQTILGEFQKLGEGMFETVGRLATQMVVVKSAYSRLGSDIGEASVGLAGFSDRLVQMYNSTADAKDGLKNFIETMNDIYNLTTNEGKKAQYSIDETRKALTGDLFKQVTGETFDVKKLFDTEYVSEQYLNLVKATGELAEKASIAETKVKEMSVAVQDAWNPKSDKGTNELSKLNAEWKTVYGGKDYYSATWDDIISDTWRNFIKLNKNTNSLYVEMNNILDANTAKKSAGIAAGGLTITPEQQKANLAAAQSESEAAAALAKNSQSLVYVLEPFINKLVPKLNNLVDAYLKSTMSAEKWLGVERSRIIKKEYANITENMRDYAEYSDITNAMIKQGFEGLTNASEVSAESMQRFVWTLEDSAKSFDKLSNSGKYLLDFSRGIKQWVENLRATQLGSPSTQIEAARRAFNEQLNLAKFAPDAETKRGALSGITGYADTFINAIKSFYGSSEEGQKQLQNVVDEVSNLEKGLTIQELQLGALQDIKDAIMDSAITIPKGISEESAKIYESLLYKAQIAGSEYKALPTVENALKFDAFAKVVMTIDRQSQSQDAKFVDELIKSVIGEKGISTAIDVVINNATLTGGQKESVLNNLTAEFNEALEGFNGLEKVASEITRVNELWNGIKLDTTPVNDAGITVKGLTNELENYSGEYDAVILLSGADSVLSKIKDPTKKVVDFGLLDAKAKIGLEQGSFNKTVADLAQITASANAARDAMNALNMADAKAREDAMKPAPTPFNDVLAREGAYKAQQVAQFKTFADKYGKGTISASVISPENLSTIAGLVNSRFGYSLSASDISSAQALNGNLYATHGNKTSIVYDDYKFADGGVFTNGIVSKPTAFNMGLMGEAGSEAIMPLVNIGGSLGVRAVNDSSVDTAKTIEELKTIVRQQDAMIRVMQDGFSKLQAENKEQNENLNNLASSVRLQART